MLGVYKIKRQSTSGIICLTIRVAIAKGKDPVNKHPRKVQWKSSGFVGSPRKSSVQDARYLINIKIDSGKKKNEISEFQIPDIAACKYTKQNKKMRFFFKFQNLKYQILQHVNTQNKKRKQIIIYDIFLYLEEHVYVPKIVFSEGATLYLPGHFIRHYVKIWGNLQKVIGSSR